MINKILLMIITFALALNVACMGDLEKEDLSETVDNSNALNTTQSLDSEEDNALQMFLQAIQNVEDADSFYTKTEGFTKSLGVTQEISAKRYVIGELMFKESVSYSKLVKTATQVLVANGKYLVRGKERVSSVNEVEWKNEASEITEDEYLSRYGSVIFGFSNYVINEQTITSVDLTKTDCYEFSITLDLHLSTVYMTKEMKTNAHSENYPTFTDIKVTVKTDLSLQVISVRYECKYNIKMPLLGEMDCEEDTTEYFYSFNQTSSFPEQEFFSLYV